MNLALCKASSKYFTKLTLESLQPGIKKTDNSRFYSDLEFVRPIYFAKNVKKIGPKNNLFSVEYLNKNTQGHLKW